MNAKRIKKLLTVVLTTSMVVGCTVTAFADAGVGEGSGTYEGGEMKYPTLSVTLPTIPSGTYDYIADPNGLIAATSAARYDEATFTGSSGIFFLTEDAVEGGAKAKYTNKSKAQSVENNNAQDIDVTIKLEQKTAGSEIIKYADSATFEATDKENKLYLAVTDDAQTDAKVAALGANTVATLTTTVEGVPDNYVENWDEDDGYSYILKGADDLEDWNSCSYILTGALNTNATWGDAVTFPEIKVTWSFKEHTDNAAPSIATTSYTMAADTPITVQYALGVGDLAAESIKSVIWDAYPTNNLYTNTTYITKDVDAKTFTLTATSINNMIARDGNSQTLKVTFDDDTVVTLTFNDPQ